MIMVGNDKGEKRLIHEGEYEDVYEMDDHFYLSFKKDRVVVLPYTIDSKGLLDKIGIVEDWNKVENEKVLTLISDYISTDDSTDMVAANRVLFDVIGTNMRDALDWMYLGSLYNKMSTDSTVKLYAVDITDAEIKNQEAMLEDGQDRKFRMLSSERVLQTDDMLFLASFLRLFNYFYVSSLSDKANQKEE